MNILLHFRHYPIAMGRWFDFALRDAGHQVVSVGNYDGGKIPWGDQFDFPQYAFPPDIQIPEQEFYPLDQVLAHCPFTPDLVIQAADTTALSGKAPCPNILIETDPHAVNYTMREAQADVVFCMQDFYKKPGQTWLPYGYYPPIHYPEPAKERQYDIVLSGLQYPHRQQAFIAMEKAGLKVYSTLGMLYDEYRALYMQAPMALCWSSKQDLPARFWEGLAMKRLVLINRVPDLQHLEFQDGVHYVGFSSTKELVEKALYFASHPELGLKIAQAGYEAVLKHTYANRVEQMMKVIHDQT